MDFEQYLKPCYEDAVRFAWSLSGSKAQGDDLLQDSLIRAWRAFPKLRDRERFKSWLLKIISNTHRSLARRQWIKRMVGLDSAAQMPAQEELAWDEKEAVRMALSKLPLPQRESLVLFEVLGMSIAEIAAQQKVTESAVKSRLSRGRERLRNHYEMLTSQEAYHEPGVIQTR